MSPMAVRVGARCRDGSGAEYSDDGQQAAVRVVVRSLKLRVPPAPGWPRRPPSTQESAPGSRCYTAVR